jgi:hypothetical protein
MPPTGHRVPQVFSTLYSHRGKGIDTAIASDMVSLAWEDAYDIGVLVGADADLVPVAEFLDKKGKQIIQAGFPPRKGTRHQVLGVIRFLRLQGCAGVRPSRTKEIGTAPDSNCTTTRTPVIGQSDPSPAPPPEAADR